MGSCGVFTGEEDLQSNNVLHVLHWSCFVSRTLPSDRKPSPKERMALEVRLNDVKQAWRPKRTQFQELLSDEMKDL